MEREIRDMKEAEASEGAQLQRSSPADRADSPKREGEELPSLESLISEISHADILNGNQTLEDIELTRSVFCELFLQ